MSKLFAESLDSRESLESIHEQVGIPAEGLNAGEVRGWGWDCDSDFFVNHWGWNVFRVTAVGFLVVEPFSMALDREDASLLPGCSDWVCSMSFVLCAMLCVFPLSPHVTLFICPSLLFSLCPPQFAG